MRHDFNDHLLAISALSGGGDTERLNSYIQKIREGLTQLDNAVFCNNPAVNAVIAGKYQLAADKGLKLDISYTIDECEIDEIYLCSIISNMLQNAVENTSANGLIDFKGFIRAGNVVISVKNDCVFENKELSTTKSDKNNHGFGIKIIRDIADQLDGNCIFEYNDNRFSSIINMPIGEKHHDKHCGYR